MKPKNTIPPPLRRVVRQPETSALVGLCDVHLRRMEADGRFPRRFKLNPDSGQHGAVGWDLQELLAWITERRASRRAA
jgi:predicted DNA-binding transcriptional regulator AlpA